VETQIQKPDKSQGKGTVSMNHITKQSVRECDDQGIWGGHKQGYHLEVQISGKPVQMELDTGVAISVMSEQQWNSLFPEAETLPPYMGQPLRGYSEH